MVMKATEGSGTHAGCPLVCCALYERGGSPDAAKAARRAPVDERPAPDPPEFRCGGASQSSLHLTSPVMETHETSRYEDESCLVWAPEPLPESEARGPARPAAPLAPYGRPNGAVLVGR